MIVLLVVKDNHQAASQAAAGLVPVPVVERPGDELFLELLSDELRQASDSDQLVDPVLGSVGSVDVDQEVLVDEPG